MGILDVLATAYLNDIMIYSKTQKDHQWHVRDVPMRLCQFCLFRKLSKYEFRVMITSFLRFVVSTNGVSMESNWVELILNWPKSRSYRDIPVFLGFANFY